MLETEHDSRVHITHCIKTTHSTVGPNSTKCLAVDSVDLNLDNCRKTQQFKMK